MINIVYPYIPSNWEELKYSLRSAEQYFQEDFNVYILSNKCPKWVNGINYIKTNYFEDPHQDVVNKYYRIIKLVDNFIWMSDDIYFLKPTFLDDIQCQGYEPKKPDNASTWGIRINNASKLLPKSTQYNYSTHTPLYFESKKLKKLMHKYSILSGELSVKVLYFNTYNTIHKPLTNRVFKTNTSSVKIRPEHRYLCHNDAGLTDKVKEYLQYRFSIPSKFEKIKSPVPIIKIQKQNNFCTLHYTGKKENYIYDHYNFSNGYAQVPKKLAEYLTVNYPRTFSY